MVVIDSPCDAFFLGFDFKFGNSILLQLQHPKYIYLDFWLAHESAKNDCHFITRYLLSSFGEQIIHFRQMKPKRNAFRLLSYREPLIPVFIQS
jgi:hypothetical protein